MKDLIFKVSLKEKHKNILKKKKIPQYIFEEVAAAMAKVDWLGTVYTCNKCASKTHWWYAFCNGCGDRIDSSKGYHLVNLEEDTIKDIINFIKIARGKK